MIISTNLRLLPILLMTILVAGCFGSGDRKQSYFDRGMELYNQANYVKAKLEFKNVLQIDPKDVEAYYMLGQIEEKDQNWRKAYAFYTRAVELNPKHTGAQVHLGRLYILSGEADKALKAAQAALEVDPKDAPAMVLKGLAQARLDHKARAIEQAQAALAADPKNLDAFSLLSALYADRGDLDQAIALIRQGLQENPKELVLHLLLAQFYEKSGDTKGAIGQLREMIRLQPDQFQQRLRLASYLLQKGREDQAGKVLQQAVSDLPDSTDAKLALVDFYIQRHQKGKAISALSGYIAEAPEEYGLQLRLAQLYASSKQLERAKKILGEVIERAGETGDGLQARNQLAKLLMLKRQQHEQALALVNEVLQEDAKDQEALLIRAALSIESKDPDGAIADLRTALKENPIFTKAYRLKARAHLMKGEIKLARESLEDAIRAKPDEAAANFDLVQLLVKLGKREDAISVLEKMREFAPDNETVLQSIATIRLAQKKWRELERTAELLIEKHPEEEKGYYYKGLALQGLGQHEQAIAAFEKTLSLWPKAIEPLIGSARSYMALGKTETALTHVRKVLREIPEHYLAFNLEGELLSSLKRWDEAEAAFRQAIKLKPDWSQPYQNLVKLKQVQGDEAAVISVLQEGFTQAKSPLLGVELANQLDKVGRGEEAKAIYQGLLKQDANNRLAANNLAMLLLKGEPDQARIEQALALLKGFELSDNPLYLDTLGLAQIKGNRLHEAVETLRRAVQAKSGLAEIEYHLGLAYYGLKKQEQARKHLSLATAAGQEFDGIEQARALLDELRKPQ